MAHLSVQSSSTTYYSKLETPATQQRPARLRDRLWEGWRTTVSAGVIITLIALIVNFFILNWASTQKPPDNQTGAGMVTFYSGTCTEINKIFTWSHLGVNVVSTLLLSAADNFLHAGPWNISGLGTMDSPQIQYLQDNVASLVNDSQIQYLQDNLASLVKLDNGDCVKAYQTSLVSSYKDVLLVTGVSNTTNAVLGIIPQLVGQYSVEGSTCFYSFTCYTGSQKDETDWTFTWYPGTGFQTPNTASNQSGLGNPYHTQVSVDYCLAEPSSEECTISLSCVYLGVVIICNAIKLACIVSTLALKGYHHLITIGDAIESFLIYPDEMTRATTLSASEVRKQKAASQRSIISTRLWFPFKHVWAEAASARRWAITSLCLLVVWAAALALLIEGATVPNGDSDIWRNGLGVLSVGSVLPFSESYGVTVDVLIVNSPQVVLSFIYLMYNGLFTCMLLSAEYLKFATQRMSLRVTCPRNTQRSTYWLQLPYRYAIPFLTAMGLLHWFVSQRIFLVRIAVIDQDGNPDDGREIGGCGWSPDALIATVVLGALMILTLFGFGFKRTPDGMPIGSSCSAAISAACHRADSEGEDVLLFPLQYGVVKGGKEGVQQVGFSAGDVQPLVEETIYGCRSEGYCRNDEEEDY